MECLLFWPCDYFLVRILFDIVGDHSFAFSLPFFLTVYLRGRECVGCNNGMLIDMGGNFKLPHPRACHDFVARHGSLLSQALTCASKLSQIGGTLARRHGPHHLKLNFGARVRSHCLIHVNQANRGPPRKSNFQQISTQQVLDRLNLL